MNEMTTTTETQEINLETLLNWSAPKRVPTRNGDRNLRKADATAAFWQVWRAHKEALKAAGISVAPIKGGEKWEALWWARVDGATLQAEAVTKQAERARAAELTPEQEARFAELTPKLLPYQPPSVRRLADALTRHGGALDASDTGTGKTFTALAATVVLDAPSFVVCPKAVIPSWKRAAAHFGIRLAGVSNYELLRRGTTPAVKLVNDGKTEQFVWQLPANTVIVFDEIHRCKDYKTLNCALALAALRQGYKVIGLSATAADNPMQMKCSGLLTKCFDNEKKFFPWMMRNGVTRGRFGLEFTGGRRELDRIHQEIFPQHGTRIRIADLGDAFPETQITAEAYELNGATEQINRIYEEMAAEIARIQASEAEDKGACILTAILRARQKAEVLKIPAIADMAADAIEEGMSVAIFVNFDDSADALMAKLKTKCSIRGTQSGPKGAAEREACIADFQADRSPVIVCNIRAGGVGVSLHGTPTSRRRLSIICPTYSGGEMKQALGRVWRANGAKSIQRIFFAAGTIEEQVCRAVKEKIGRIDTLNDGDVSLRGEVRVQPTLEDAAPVVTSITVPVLAPAAPAKPGQPAAPAKKPAPELSPEIRARALQGMQTLAARCNYASTEDGAGFGKFDANIGHEFAGKASLSNGQAAWAAKLCIKYRRQLGDDFVAPFYAALGLERHE